jgi:hypothetical protein
MQNLHVMRLLEKLFHVEAEMSRLKRTRMLGTLSLPKDPQISLFIKRDKVSNAKKVYELKLSRKHTCSPCSMCERALSLRVSLREIPNT